MNIRANHCKRTQCSRNYYKPVQSPDICGSHSPFNVQVIVFSRLWSGNQYPKKHWYLSCVPYIAKDVFLVEFPTVGAIGQVISENVYETIKAIQILTQFDVFDKKAMFYYVHSILLEITFTFFNTCSWVRSIYFMNEIALLFNKVLGDVNWNVRQPQYLFIYTGEWKGWIVISRN